jgi:uncharacterized protein (TIGR02391 family)
MATLLVPRKEAKQAIEQYIKSGNDLIGKAEVAERTAGYRDWLVLVEAWRKDTIAVLNKLYEGTDIGQGFGFTSQVAERSSPMYTFPYAKMRLQNGVDWLQNLIERLELTVGASQDATALESLHPEIYSRCRKLYESSDYAEAVEKGFKIVRDRLRALTGHETGSEAFGKGSLYINGAAASHVDDDFQNGIKFLTMAIDRFRNEKSHTADGNIEDPIRAYEYLRLSSLAMHLLDGGQIGTS